MYTQDIVGAIRERIISGSFSLIAFNCTNFTVAPRTIEKKKEKEKKEKFSASFATNKQTSRMKKRGETIKSTAWLIKPLLHPPLHPRFQNPPKDIHSCLYSIYPIYSIRNAEFSLSLFPRDDSLFFLFFMEGERERGTYSCVDEADEDESRPHWYISISRYRNSYRRLIQFDDPPPLSPSPGPSFNKGKFALSLNTWPIHTGDWSETHLRYDFGEVEAFSPVNSIYIYIYISIRNSRNSKPFDRSVSKVTSFPLRIKGSFFIFVPLLFISFLSSLKSRGKRFSIEKSSRSMNFPFLLPLNPFFHPRDFRGAWEKRDCATAARDLDSLDKRASPLFTCYFIIGIRISFSLSCTQSIPSHWFTPVARINLVRYETTLSPFIDNDASRVNVIRKRDTWPLSLYPFLSQIRLDTHSILFLIEKPSIDAATTNLRIVSFFLLLEYHV